ncbi:MAG TPA: type I restriction-modification system subunit M N-terminal domain-containing protein [Terrimicrobiaceae bacterium]
MPINKTELYSSIWKSCKELRGGGMCASQYKDHVLVLLFAKYVSQRGYLLDVPEGGQFADRGAVYL